MLLLGVIGLFGFVITYVVDRLLLVLLTLLLICCYLPLLLLLRFGYCLSHVGALCWCIVDYCDHCDVIVMLTRY